MFVKRPTIKDKQTNPPSYYEENQIGWERPINWKQNRQLSILYS